MNFEKSIALKALSYFIALLVFNISMNISDNVVGKAGPAYVYVNEIETMYEFVAEIILDKKDFCPETQTPGGTLGFEEEETHFLEKKNTMQHHNYVRGTLYKKNHLLKPNKFKNHIPEINTPPPRT